MLAADAAAAFTVRLLLDVDAPDEAMMLMACAERDI